MAKIIFTTSAKQDFLALAVHDPTILTYRRCTSEDMRKLGPLCGFDWYRTKRAFNLALFQKKKYLTLTLDPNFEPKADVRERAKLRLERMARREAAEKAASEAKRKAALKATEVAAKKAAGVAARKAAIPKLERYVF